MDHIFINGHIRLYDGEDTDGDKLKKDYSCSQSVGDLNGMHYELHEHNDEVLFMVVFSTTSSSTYIRCESWIDLIGLLEKLSGIVLAAMFDQSVIDAVSELIQPVLDDRHQRIKRLRKQ